jgi:Vitamin K-dependent gamma-carboxylase
MTAALSRIGAGFRAWLFAPTPAERLALVRILICGFATYYLLRYSGAMLNVATLSARDFAPVGPIAMLDAPLPRDWVFAIYVLACSSGVFATLGLKYLFTGPVFALTLLWAASYRNSFGMVFHTENLLVLHVLILACGRAADAWSVDAWKPKAEKARREEEGEYSWPLRALCIVTTIVYLLAGIAKLRLTGWHWGGGEELRIHIAYDGIRKVEMGSSPTLASKIVPLSWLFPPLAVLTLLFELGAPLALLGRRIAFLWGLGAWGFHMGVLKVMSILFIYPISGIAFAPFFPLEKAVYWVRDQIATRLPGRP